MSTPRQILDGITHAALSKFHTFLEAQLRQNIVKEHIIKY